MIIEDFFRGFHIFIVLTIFRNKYCKTWSSSKISRLKVIGVICITILRNIVRFERKDHQNSSAE